ncbi:MAG: alpha/beta fold hydrolase [Candidatus Dormibacteria bacterium]
MNTSQGRRVRANGIDIHYLEAGAGEPLVVLNNGMISTSPVWAEWPSSYAAYMGTLAEHFRVIAPDFRGSGKTIHPGGAIPYTLLADDVVALIEALHLDQPFICGYGDGGEVATIVGIREPGSVRAIANHAGFELLNPDPQSPALVMTRQMLGGRADATEADADAVAASEFLGRMVELMKTDHDAAQGSGHWRSVLNWTFDRVSRPSGYAHEDLQAITAATLVLVGDRDQFCPVEEAVSSYRALRDGELAVLPNTPGGINAAAVQMMIDFFERRLGTRS